MPNYGADCWMEMLVEKKVVVLASVLPPVKLVTL